MRVPAAHVERPVAEAVIKLSSNRAASQADIRGLIDRVMIGSTTIPIQLSEVAEAHTGARILTLPWSSPSPYRKREIVQAANNANILARPMRANARAIVHRSSPQRAPLAGRTCDRSPPHPGDARFARGQDRALDPDDPVLAFLAPDMVKAAVEGRLPRGHGLKRLVDLPMAWPDQWRALGLAATA